MGTITPTTPSMGQFTEPPERVWRPSVRVGELMPLSPVSRPDESLSEPDTIVTVEGSHSLAVCAQAARRITSLAERCDNLMHLERFGIGAYSLLHAARMHLIIAAVPTPPRKTGGRAGGCGAGAQFMEAIRRKEQAVDQFHRTLGSLRKFSVYHWTMDGIGLSIRTFERTLAAILQEQEIDQEQELKRQRERLAQYDTEFFDRDHNGSVVVAVDNTSATVNEAPTDENAASENKSEDELFYERTYYESMRFLEMRLLYQERHRHSKGSRPEEYLRRLDFLSQLNPGMGFASRGGHLDSTVPALTHRSITRNTVELFDNNANDRFWRPPTMIAPLTPRPDGTIAHKAANISSVPTPNVPGLVIKTYKPNVSGRSKRRHASNAVTSGAASTSIRSKPTSGPPKTTENNSISTGHPAERAMLQDDADMNSSVDTSMSTTYANNASSNAVGVPSVSATYTRNHRNEVLSSNESPLSMTEFRPVEWTLPSSASQGIMDSQMQQPPRPSQFNSSGVPLVSIAAHDAPTGQSSGGASSSIATAVMSGIRLNGHGATRGQSTQHSPSRKHGRPVYRSERLFLQQQQHNQMQQHLDLQSRQYHYQQRLLQQQPQPQSSPSLQHPEQMQAQQRQSSSPSNMQAGQTPVQQESSHQQNPATQLRKNAYIITTPSTGKTNPDILMVYANDMDSEVCETSVLVHTQQLPPQHVQKHLQHQPPQHIQKHMEQQARYTLRTRSSGPLQVQNHQQLEHNMLLPLQQQAPTFSQPIEQQRGYQGERQQGQNQSHVFAQQVNQPATETQAYSQNRHQVPMPGEDIGQGNLPSGFGSGQPVSHSQMLHRQQMQRQQQSQQQHHHQISGHRPPQTSNGSPAGSSASLMSPSPAASSNSTTPSPMTHSSAIVPGLPVTPSAGPVIHLASVTGAMGLFDTDFPSDTPNNADSGVDGSQQMPSGGGNNDMYWDQFG
ncbi:hypothetical protein EDD21DRAFT_349329 [Dissophora ornata]|nr:hypothetical protein EDD21DRAFT_349329 [Dissophora ornata]